MNFKKFIADYFTFNKSERRGIIGLSLLVIVLIAVKIGIRFFSIQSEDFDITPFKTEIELFEKSIDSTRKSKYHLASNEYNTNSKPFEKQTQINQPFNPNNQSIDFWIGIGLSPKQASVIKNFESKGGKFRKKEDVKKMYVINDKIYQSIEPWLIFDENKSETQISNQSSNIEREIEKIEQKKIDINTADTMELVKIKGIGPAFARRIVKFRDKLGGFYSKTQLMDVYGITPEVYQSIENQIEISEKNITKINLNYCTYDDLTKFPYFTYTISKSIIKHREQKGFFTAVEQLKTNNLVSEDLYIKIAPYFEVKK
jgi:competence ComEA-like helix-hairpin-helix protein